jgi:hypothetical protein
MNKNTKLLLGVGVVAAAAYYFWNKSKTTAASPAAPAQFIGSDGSAPCPANKDEKYLGIDMQKGVLYCTDGLYTHEYKVKKSGNR